MNQQRSYTRSLQKRKRSLYIIPQEKLALIIVCNSLRAWLINGPQYAGSSKGSSDLNIWS